MFSIVCLYNSMKICEWDWKWEINKHYSDQKSLCEDNESCFKTCSCLTSASFLCQCDLRMTRHFLHSGQSVIRWSYSFWSFRWISSTILEGRLSWSNDLKDFLKTKKKQKNCWLPKVFCFFLSYLFFPKNEKQKLHDLKDFLEMKPSFYNSILFFIWGILIWRSSG
jgi:hypothetical protein